MDEKTNELADIRALRQRLDDLRELSSDEMLQSYGEQLQKISAVSKNAAKPRTARRYPYVIAAAVCLALLLVATLRPGMDRAQKFTYFNPGPAPMNVVLPDNTSVWLKENATLTYSDNGVRLVTMQGESFFDVAKDASKPFVVDAGKLKVKVYGTSFSVRTSGDATEVSLAKGSVAIQNGKGKNMLFLSPGQQASYIASEDILKVKEVSVHDILLTRYGIINLADKTVPELLAEVGSIYGSTLSVSGQADARRFTLNFPRSASLEEVMLTIELMTGAKVAVEN